MNFVLRRTWVRVLLAALVLLALAAYVVPHLLYPARPAEQQTAALMKAQAALQGGAKVWAAHCAHCHAPAAGAPVGPVLNGRALPPEAVQVIVRRGLRSMPAFLPSSIDDVQLVELARHVSQLPAGSAPGVSR